MSAAPSPSMPPIGDTDQATTIGIIDRLARLEGLLVGLQSSITQSQQQWLTSQQKVELLERRLVQLEASQVTKEDMKELSTKVDALINNNAKTSGGTNVVTWTVKNAAPWIAIALSLMAMKEASSPRAVVDVTPEIQETPHRGRSLR